MFYPIIHGSNYTGHEHLAEFGLINMLSAAKSRERSETGNGRIYDSEIARFLSTDPVIQDPYNILSYNRYTYCLNNPLKYTDPSGHTMRAMYEQDYSWRDTPAEFFNNYPGVWETYTRAIMRGYQGGYGNFTDQYYKSLFTEGGCGVSSSGEGGFTIRWETRYTFTNGTKQEVRDDKGNLLYIILPNIGIGYSRGSIYVGGTNSFNNPPAGQGGEQNQIHDNLKNAMPVAITWAVVGSAEGVMAGQVTPAGYGIILRGPNRFQSIGFSSAGAGAGWVGADGSIATTYYFYTGDVNNFNRFSLNGQAWDLSVSCGEGWSMGINLAIAQDRYGAYIIGIGPSAGVGGSPTFFTGQYSMTLTKIWK